MSRRTVVISLKIEIRDYTSAERKDEGLSKEDCEGSAGACDKDILTAAIAHFIEDQQDEALAGSDLLIKIESVEPI